MTGDPTNGDPAEREARSSCVEVVVYGPDLAERETLSIERGSNLRRALVDADHSPYTAITERANCGGRGLCATCGVWIDDGAPEPDHWHDALADRWGFPRLSCQVTVDSDLAVRMPSKLVWGFGGRMRE